jgi:virginiamycin B lyase
MNLKFLSRRNLLLLAAATLVIAAVLLWRLWPRAHGHFVEYPMALATDIPTAVAIAPDGTVWFTIDTAGAMGVIRDGKIARLATVRKIVEPIGLAVDAEGAAWYGDASGAMISRMLPGGEIKSFPLGTPIARLGRLTVAADGAVWFAEGTGYGFTRLKDGVLARNVPKSVRGGPYGVAVDAQGNLWGTLQSGNQIVKISPAGEIAEYEVPTRGSSPSDIVVDGAGNTWFLEFRSNKIAKFAGGKFNEFEVPGEWGGLTGLTAAPDGSVWFGLLRRHLLGRLRDGEIKMFPLPRADARPYTLAADRQGNIWYADISGYVGMLRADAAKR